MSKRILGVDLGDARTGLALSDPTGLLAGGIGCIHERYDREIAKQVAEAAQSHEAELIVIGNPINMNGTLGPRSEKITAFIALLSEFCSIPVVKQDERLTTVAAHQYLSDTNIRSKKRRSVVDTLSAQIILQNYLDKTRNQS